MRADDLYAKLDDYDGVPGVGPLRTLLDPLHFRGLAQDHSHLVAGMWPLRFSHWQIAREKTYVVGILRKTAGRARGG